MKLNKSKFLLGFFATLTMFLGNLMTTNVIISQYNIDNKWIFNLTFSIILAFFVFRISFIISKQKLIFLIIWELLILTIFLSNYLNGKFIFIEFILYSILIPVSYFSVNIIKNKKVLIISFIISVIPFFYILGTGNALGMLLCVFGIVLINFINNKQIDNKETFIYSIILLVGILIFITNSRTSLITFTTVSAIQVLVLFVKNSKSMFSIVKKVFFVFTISILLYASLDYLNNLLFNKFTNTSKDISSGRVDIWQHIITTKVNVFGNNIDYFYSYGIRDAHNIFIQVLADYGILSFIFFVLLFLFIVIKSIRIKKLDYLLFFLGYFLLGLTENVLFINNRLIAIDILFFMYLGCLINEKNHHKVKNLLRSG